MKEEPTTGPKMTHKSQSTLRYLHGPGVDIVLAQENVDKPLGDVDRTWWLLIDQLGSTRDVVNSTGKVVAHFQFDAFGVLLDGRENVTRYQFTGREHDSHTDYNYHRARWYDPTTGRWLSEDPIRLGGGDVNLSRYVGNGPTNGVDPSGLEEEIARPGENWQLIYIFAFSDQTPSYVVRKVSSAALAASEGMTPTGPNEFLHPIEHCLNQHAGGKTPYLSASELPQGAPNIKGEPVWVDLNKVKAEVTTYDDILAMSNDFLERNPHLKDRFEQWKKAGEREVLIKGRVPPQAVVTKNGLRLRTTIKVAGKALFLYAIYADTRSFIEAEDRAGEAARIAGGWAGAWAGGCIGGSAGGKAGAAAALALGFAGPQAAAPEEILTVPVGTGIGGFLGAIGGSIGGYWAGSRAGRNYYNFINFYMNQK